MNQKAKIAAVLVFGTGLMLAAQNKLISESAALGMLLVLTLVIRFVFVN